MIRHFLYVFLTLVAFGFAACSKDEIANISQNESITMSTDSAFDKDMSNFALAVSRSLSNSKEFRNIVKEEASKQFDGDYDILLSNLTGKKIRNPQILKLRSTDGDGASVKNLLEEYYPGNKTKSTSSSAIDDLLEKYPLLQVSVPVNAEKWTDDTYIPDVVFLAADYDEENTKTISGFNAKGEIVTLDAINAPAVPVIVIGMNERVSANETSLRSSSLPSPNSFSGSVAENGMLLTWQKPTGSNSSNVSGYYIYRKGSSDNAYVNIATIPGVDNLSYLDTQVNSLNAYSYYIVAFNNSVVSDPSSYVSIIASSRPNAVTSFDANQSSTNAVELRWINDYSKSFKETVISRRSVNDTEYKVIKTCSPSETYYFDTNVVPGERYVYQVKNMTTSGEYTNAQYDMVQLAYRDINSKTKVYIKAIRYNSYKAIESWPNGLPEFNISVLNIDRSNNNQSYKIVENRRFDMTRHVQQDCNILILDGWEPKYWYDRMTYTVYEIDGGKDISADFNASFNFIVPDSIRKLLKLDTGSGLKIQVKYNKSDDYCGMAFSDYFDPLSKWIDCNGAGGVGLLIQDKL